MMAIRQYDVYIERDSLPGEEDKLLLVQFPSLNSQFNNDSELLDLAVKPKCMKVKLEVDLDSTSRNFSNRRAELLAEKSKPQSFPHRKVNRNIYTSTRNFLDDKQLFVCKTVDNKLVCRSVSEVIALRSDLTHFDLKEEVDPREEIRPVSVKFSSTDRQNAPSKPKDNSHEDESLEDYKPFTLFDCESNEAKLQREYLFGIQAIPNVRIKPDPDAEMEPVDKKPIIPSTSTCEVPDIKPKIEKMDIDDIYTSESRNQPGSPRKSNLTRQRVKECLLKAKLVSFEEIYKYLKDYKDFTGQSMDGDQMSINVKDLVDALSEHALLVQGNWAIKSETLYGDSTVRNATDVTGVSITLFTAARDYLIWLFSQERLVSRPKFTKQVKLPDHDVMELFQQLATFRPDLRKWELKLPTDQRFLDKFPDVVNRQNTFWKVRKANRLGIFMKS